MNITTGILTAHWDSFRDEAHPIFATIRVEFGADKAAAEEMLSKLPKSYGAHMDTLVHHEATGTNRPGYSLRVRATLAPTKGNDRNETGIRRLAAVERKLAALGVEILFHNDPKCMNSYRTREAFNAAIANPS